jgi:2-amino-4-hydroxy-6-hydroxymethyldihydropteridine diphosphokinase
MIAIGLGGNLPSAAYGPPRETLEAALAALTRQGVAVTRRSGWYATEPVPPSGQPWFVNAVALLDAPLSSAALLALLQRLERQFGRERRAERNAARTIDLDLLDHDGSILDTAYLTLPHPRLHLRRFVLLPLAEIAPEWRHPILGCGAAELLARLGDDQSVRPLGPKGGAP